MSDPDAPAFRGEDESAGLASPALDLAAAAILLALGLFFAAVSLAMPAPGGWRSAPGLLPFLTSASLAVMATVLGLSALARGRATGLRLDGALTDDGARRIVLILAVAAYVGALDLLSLEGFVTIAGRAVPVGGFEPATIVFLTLLLRIFWTDRLWHCLAVALGWTAMLVLAFRTLFDLPLPG